MRLLEADAARLHLSLDVGAVLDLAALPDLLVLRFVQDQQAERSGEVEPFGADTWFSPPTCPTASIRSSPRPSRTPWIEHRRS
ncbi:hypothetical protein [Streptomyces sp. CBMA156]|uniref:hypothetical protein n=1 Tax=Streptomyces sp. CBMA156 TaxID=1930280 RepID=UPI001661CAB1|nr:hypothetical protein [Streptomyces sp. CBMA156]MBD0675484.1 hypothetical protein [Streptomyces sp. CBMA156]